MSDQKSLLLAACFVASACLILGANGANARGGHSSGGGGQSHHDDQNRETKKSGERAQERKAAKKAADKAKLATPKKDETKNATMTAPSTPASTAKTAEPTVPVQGHSGAIVTNTGIVGRASAAPAASAVSTQIHNGAIVTGGGTANVTAPTAIVRDHRGTTAVAPVAAPAPTASSSSVIVRDHRGDGAGYANPSLGQAVKDGAGNFGSQLKDGFIRGGKEIGSEATSVASRAASVAKSVYHFVGGLF